MLLTLSNFLKKNYFYLFSILPITISLFFEGSFYGFLLLLIFLLISIFSRSLLGIICSGIILHLFVYYSLTTIYTSNISGGLWFQVFASWISAIIFVSRLAFIKPKNDFLKKLMILVVPFFFGLWVILLWELICVGFNVPLLLLPAPSLIGVQISNSLDILYADFYQTFPERVVYRALNSIMERLQCSAASIYNLALAAIRQGTGILWNVEPRMGTALKPLRVYYILSY